MVENAADLIAFIDEERDEDGMHGMRKRRRHLHGDLVKALKDSGQKTKWNSKLQRPNKNPPQVLALSYVGHAIEKAVGNHVEAQTYIDNITLEHIVPVKTAHAMEAPMEPKAFQAMVTALGNLTLLTDSENSQASNRPLAQKMSGYAASSVALTRGLTCPLVFSGSRAEHAKMLANLSQISERFDARGVEERSQRMAETMAAIFVG